MLREAPLWRLLRVLDEPDHPVFYRVLWRAHVAEWSDLTQPERHLCADLLAKLELSIRQTLLGLGLAPRKINIASLGNLVPHLHWHVIARYDLDRQFPSPIWAAPKRPVDAAHLARLRDSLGALDAAVQQALAQFD